MEPRNLQKNLQPCDGSHGPYHRVALRTSPLCHIKEIPDDKSKNLIVDNTRSMCRVWIVPRSLYVTVLYCRVARKINWHIEQSQRSYSYLINSLYIASKKQSRCLDYPIHLSFFIKKNIFQTQLKFVFDAVLKGTNNKSSSETFDHIH